MPKWAPLIGFLVAAYAVAAIGGLSSSAGVSGWYASADRPGFTPPNWLFGPVWTVLYGAMAVAAWLAWLKRADLRLWWVQLALNFAWSPVFFAWQQLWLGLVVIVALDVTVAVTAWKFARVSKPAAWLLVPYLAWILYATALNLGIAVLN
ncbi:TspO/MBR family protein [Allokutzneria oryzae]|uniref:TspO/MBR family protein n=1 Tax=Allokutzneria oryzae TaxID=1378989 RepID=A0ABV6A444_9PSEU